MQQHLRIKQTDAIHPIHNSHALIHPFEEQAELHRICNLGRSCVIASAHECSFHDPQRYRHSDDSFMVSKNEFINDLLDNNTPLYCQH